MKKILLVLFLLLSFNGLFIKADEDSIFSWPELNVKVELGEDLQVILADIKKNIKLKEGYDDPDFRVINNNINYTTQSTINTNYLKIYRLDHKAVSDKYNKSEIRSVYLHVVDTKPPKVISSVSFKIAYGQGEQNFLTGLVITDNHTAKENIEVVVDQSNIDYTKIGTYEILYTITDASGNKLFHTEYLEIVDLIKPTITKIKDLVVQVKSEFLITDYFEIKDNYDLDPTIKYEFQENLNILGTNKITITVTDQSGNSTVYIDEFLVVDEIAPVITLSESSVSIKLNEELDFYYYVEVSDNYDLVTLEDLIITNNINYEVVGSYLVTYELSDSFNNKTIKTLTVLVKDLTKPVIHANDLTIPKGEVKDFLLSVTVTDNYSETEKISLRIIYNDVNFNEPGAYSVRFEAVDEHGNHEYKTIQVTITGKTNEQLIFYSLIVLAVIAAVTIGIVFIVKKTKKH